jgi:predicted GIY-YIG superfamily endonuclease
MNPTAFSIGLSSRLYYNSKDLFLHNPIYYYGCKNKPRSIIQKKGIPVTDYLYANLKLGEWKITTRECKKAQLLISATWADRYIILPTGRGEIQRGEIQRGEIQRGEIQDSPKDMSEIEIISVEPLAEDSVANVIEPLDDIVEAPRVIYLEEHEMFRDTDGKVVDIEVRGERNHKNVYFNVKDVGTLFEMTNFQRNILLEHSSYEKNDHYKHFFIRADYYLVVNDTIKKELYLTYKGLLKVLFASRSGNAEKFQDWAMEILFAAQMGTEEQRINVGATVLRSTPRTIKSIFSKSATQFPCIYLISLGKVSDLRDTFKIDPSIPDDTKLYKYGLTNDLSRRMMEHDNNYGRMKNVDIIVSIFQGIDPQYLSKAERNIRQQCNAYSINLQHEEYKELIFLNKTQFTHLKDYFEMIGQRYSGHSKELNDKIKKLENEIEKMLHEKTEAELRFQMELKDVQMKLQQEKSETMKHKTACETKDEIFGLKEENYRLQIQILKNPTFS